MRSYSVKRAIHLNDFAWKFVALSEIAGFAYLFWAVSNATHVRLISF